MTQDAGGGAAAADLIVEEIRRQVDQQIVAARDTDTKAAGLVAALFALVVLVIPRVHLATSAQVATAGATLLLVLGTLGALGLAIRPRIGGFSYGPDASDMLEFLNSRPDELTREMASAYEKVRLQNEAVIQTKGKALIGAIVGLVCAVVGLSAMVVTGGIK